MPYGLLDTDGSTAAGDSVYFRPEDPTDPSEETAGRDWGGIFMPYESRGSSIRFADIGYAANPLFLDYPDSTTIARSRIHDFAETGLWAHGSLGEGTGIAIDSVTVERGDELEQTLGELGIYLDQTDEASLKHSTVSLAGRDALTGSAGLSVRYGKTFCESDPETARALLIEKNIILGPGNESEQIDEGIATNWVCGSALREASLLNNFIGDWKRLGVSLVQTSDIQVSCNKIVGGDRGLEIWRDSEPTGTSVRMRENRIEALSQDSTFFAVQTNDAVKTKLGPAGGSNDKGWNRLFVHLNDTKFVYELDPQSADTLNARHNYWYVHSSGTSTLATVDSLITNRLAPSAYSVDYSNYLTSDSSEVENCQVPTPSTLRGRMEVAVVDGSPASRTSGSDIPIQFSLGAPYPNPGPRGVSLSMAVSADRTGTYILQVFDIRGRSVVESRREIAAAGRYRIEWPGLDASGKSAASGIYFLRLRGPRGILETRKVTLIR